MSKIYSWLRQDNVRMLFSGVGFTLLPVGFVIATATRWQLMGVGVMVAGLGSFIVTFLWLARS